MERKSQRGGEETQADVQALQKWRENLANVNEQVESLKVLIQNKKNELKLNSGIVLKEKDYLESQKLKEINEWKELCQKTNNENDHSGFVTPFKSGLSNSVILKNNNMKNQQRNANNLNNASFFSLSTTNRGYGKLFVNLSHFFRWRFREKY